MKYWKNGFYLEQSKEKTRYEITDEYWQELLNEQSEGKEIITDNNGKPIAIIHIVTTEECTKNKIFDLKQQLKDTDYTSTRDTAKYVLGQLTDDEIAKFKTDEAQRQAWRDEINKLQENI